jgi:hypothetical protein
MLLRVACSTADAVVPAVGLAAVVASPVETTRLAVATGGKRRQRPPAKAGKAKFQINERFLKLMNFLYANLAQKKLIYPGCVGISPICENAPKS